MTAQIHAPNQAPTENTLVEQLDNDQYRVNFRPKVEGMHLITVLDDEKPIDGKFQKEFFKIYFNFRLAL